MVAKKTAINFRGLVYFAALCMLMCLLDVVRGRAVL